VKGTRGSSGKRPGKQGYNGGQTTASSRNGRRFLNKNKGRRNGSKGGGEERAGRARAEQKGQGSKKKVVRAEPLPSQE